jgi:hypothetical protein
MNGPPGITVPQDCHRYAEFIVVALQQSPSRPIDRLSRSWKDSGRLT